jgi:hypothetical protein
VPVAGGAGAGNAAFFAFERSASVAAATAGWALLAERGSLSVVPDDDGPRAVLPGGNSPLEGAVAQRVVPTWTAMRFSDGS